MMKQTLLIGILLLLSGMSLAQGLAAGPMAGANTQREVKIWYQFKDSTPVRLEYWLDTQPHKTMRTKAFAPNRDTDYSHTQVISDLQPGGHYSYRLLSEDGKWHSDTFQFFTQRLWQWREDPPAFNLMMGSCNYIDEPAYDRPGKPFGSDYDIFQSMAKQKPDYMLWLGDNVYTREVDFTSASGIFYRYRHDRQFAPLQPLLQTGHHLAIWDDHDYGPNDSNQSYIFKGESLKAFRQYWPNPSFGLPGAPGIFTLASLNDVDVFMLDDRYYRDADNSPDAPDKAMYGKAQLRWLKNALMASSANFKLIVGGSQMLNDYSSYEGWNHFTYERSAFLAWLEQAGINGVVFVSGDRHHTELLKIDRPWTYPLYELTCSSMTAGIFTSQKLLQNPVLVKDTLVGKHNFCNMHFSGKQHDRSLEISVYDHQGKLQWQKTLSQKQLQTPRQK